MPWLKTAQRWFAGLSPWRRRALAVIAGIGLTAAQPPIGAWPVVFLAWPAVFALCLTARRPREAFGYGWWAGLGFFLSGVSWIGEAFLVEASKVWWYLPLMPVAMLALASVLALFWGLGCWVAVQVHRQGWRSAVSFAAALACAETLRSTVLTGFPWALPAYVWLETPVMQVTALVGPFALSGLTVLCAVLPLVAGWRGPVLALALLMVGWGWGIDRLSEPATSTSAVIRLVQPAIDQRDKWLPENRGPIFRRLVDLSAGVSAARPTLVVWPEVAVTFTMDTNPDAIDAATAALPAGSTLAVGAVRFDGAGSGRAFNSLQFYASDGAALGVYDKRKLTPFGEYVPYAWVLGRLGIGTLGDGLSGFTPGSTEGPFSLPGLPQVSALICYEIIFPGLTRRTAVSAEWLLQVTNDAWFGDSFGPWQHLAQARVRAIETGLPVARAANTGISAMIDPWGRVTASLGLGRSGVLDSVLPRRTGPPPYARHGELFSGLILGFATALVVLPFRRRGR